MAGRDGDLNGNRDRGFQVCVMGGEFRQGQAKDRVLAEYLGECSYDRYRVKQLA